MQQSTYIAFIYRLIHLYYETGASVFRLNCMKVLPRPTLAPTKADSPYVRNPLLSKVGISSQLATCWKPFVYRPIQPLYMAAILENFIMNLSHTEYWEHCIIPYTYPAQNPPYSCLLIHPFALNKTILPRSSIIFAILTKPIPQRMKFTERTFSESIVDITIYVITSDSNNLKILPPYCAATLVLPSLGVCVKTLKHKCNLRMFIQGKALYNK